MPNVWPGINAASEIFQNAIEELLAGLPGCKNISNDIIVHGKNQTQHDAHLRAVLVNDWQLTTFV